MSNNKQSTAMPGTLPISSRFPQHQSVLVTLPFLPDLQGLV